MHIAVQALCAVACTGPGFGVEPLRCDLGVEVLVSMHLAGTTPGAVDRCGQAAVREGSGGALNPHGDAG